LLRVRPFVVTEITETFDSEAGYRAAIALTLASALREIRIFDRDLTSMAIEDRAQIELLDRFLATGPDRRLQVVLHDSMPLQTRMPRLLALMREHAHQVEVRLTPEHLRKLADCWVIADQGNGTIRFHADHARGKRIMSAPMETRPWLQRADDLWAESQPCVPWTTTGL
jgi:hypothetical protein